MQPPDLPPAGYRPAPLDQRHELSAQSPSSPHPDRWCRGPLALCGRRRRSPPVIRLRTATRPAASTRVLTRVFLTNRPKSCRRKSTVGIAPAGNPRGRFAFQLTPVSSPTAGSFDGASPRDRARGRFRERAPTSAPASFRFDSSSCTPPLYQCSERLYCKSPVDSLHYQARPLINASRPLFFLGSFA